MPVPGPIPSLPKKRKVKRSYPIRKWFLVAAILGGLAGFAWLKASWDLLGYSDVLPTHTRWAFVYDGQSPKLERLLEAESLLRSKRVDSILLSGSLLAPQLHYSTLWISRLEPSRRTPIAELRHFGTSSLSESYAATQAFREMGVDTVIVVSSFSHSGRLHAILSKVSGGHPVYLIHPSADPQLDGKWSSREARKVWIQEWFKRFYWFAWERWGANPLAQGEASMVPWSVVRPPLAGQIPCRE